MMRDKMQTLKSILLESEHCFTSTEDASGDELYEIFKQAANISDGLLEFKNAATQTIDEQNQEAVITYLLNAGNDSKIVDLHYQIDRGINISSVCSGLNELLRAGGYEGGKYFYDISQDIDASGIAFTSFAKELALSESGAIWRGYEDMEMFEGFWKRFNQYKSRK